MYIHTETKTIHSVSDSDLEEKLKQNYGGDPNIAYMLEGQRLYQTEVGGGSDDPEIIDADKAYYDKIIAQYQSEQLDFDTEVLDAMLNDMCMKSEIPAGSYSIEID